MSRLRNEYFRYPSLWRFNTPDFYVFYYVFAAIISILLIIVFLIILASSKHQASEPVPLNVEPRLKATPSPFVSPVLKASPSATPLPSPSPAQPSSSGLPSQALKSAAEEPTYALKAE